jgi:predicted phage-related endonuclease
MKGKSIMLNKEIISKIEELKELEALIREAEAEVEALKDDIKKELTEQGKEEMTVGRYVVRWTSVVSNRFDSTTFKNEMEELYNRYVKQTKSRRFSIVG